MNGFKEIGLLKREKKNLKLYFKPDCISAKIPGKALNHPLKSID